MGRTTLAMVLAFAVVGVAVLLLQRAAPPPDANANTFMLNVNNTDVQRLDITTPNGSTAFVRAEPFGWSFADSGTQADLDRVSSVVNRLAQLRSQALVTDSVSASDLGTYGLAPAVDTAMLTMKDGSQVRILIGNETVNNAGYYAIIDGHKDLHTIATLLQGDIEKLVSNPPVPTPTPVATSVSVVTPTRTPTPVPGTTPGPGTVLPTIVPTPTIGLPAPSVGE